MNNSFFDNPKEKPSGSEVSSKDEPVQIQQDNPTEPTTESDFMSVWDTDTEYREERKTTSESDTESTESVEEEDDFGIDGEAAEFAADLAVNANQEGMSRVLHWMHGEGEVADYRANNESLLRKAWHRFFTALNIKISKERGIVFANLLAFGWSLGIGIWKMIGRMFSGKFRWPWSRKKSQPEPERMMVKNPNPVQNPNPVPVAVPVPAEEAFPEEPPLKVCPQSEVAFKPGTGYPKNPELPYYDTFLNRGAYQTMLNNARTEKKKSDAKEKSEPAAAV